MNRTDKSTVIEGLVDRLNQAESVYVTDFTGLTVKSLTDLRRRLRGVGVEYVVVKNTLAIRALREVSMHGLDSALKGPTGMLFVSSDPVAAAKVIKEFQKENEKPAVKGGILAGRPVTAAEVERLATLPGREQLLAQLGGALQAPLQGFLGAATGLLQQFAGAVEALRSQRSEAAQ